MPKSSRVVPCLAIVLIALSCLGARAAEWKDPSKHTVRLVDVEPGVRLEVLDWGGSGEPVLLLAGHGDTGHIFDDFAPLLTPRSRVIAITRRGFGASSQPENGYDLKTLVYDIAQVTDVLKLPRSHLMGHSIAGDEMTRFALTYPEKVDRLIYLDAAYDRVDAQELEAQFPKLTPSPSRVNESGSPKTVQAFLARNEIMMPESEIRATRVFGPDGQFLRPITPDRILHAVATIVEHPSYESVRAPMLAIYAVYDRPAQLLPRYNFVDRRTKQTIEAIFGMWQAFAKAQRDLFRNRVPQARVVEIHGASHYVFISHQKRVLQEVLDFLDRQ